MSTRSVLTASLLLLPMVAACTGHQRTPGTFRFEGEPALGEIRVVPILHAYDAPPLRTDGYVVDGVIDARMVLREQRMDELSEVPDELATSLPGAIHARLDDAWRGHFKVGHLPMGSRSRIENALRRKDLLELEDSLAWAARGVGGQATLFTWVTELSADPLTAEGFPGDRVDTPVGPVIVDVFEEPYRVRAELGMALVRADGLVVLRYTDRSASVLSPHRNASRVGRDLAIDLAGEVVKMWPDDPRLWRNNRPIPEACPDEDEASPSLVESKRPAGRAGGDTETAALPEIPFHGIRKASDPR